MPGIFLPATVLFYSLAAVIPAHAADSRTTRLLMTEAEYATLARANIYFGHQSVGYNIIEGVKDLLEQEPRLQLRIEETDTPSGFQGGRFAHGRVGENQDPVSKIDDFAEKMKSTKGPLPDMAFFKLCYIDIMADRNIEDLFEHYRATMATLKTAVPQTIFIHVTVPLTVVQSGPRMLIKKMIGRAPGGYLDNRRRNQFNHLLRLAYSGKEPVFDLAAIESTHAGGKRALFKWQGQAYEHLVADYSHDGRHLNEFGRSRVAGQMLLFLARTELDASRNLSPAE